MSDLARLGNFFRQRRHRRIGLPTLGKVMSPFSVTKRISELRDRGYVITNTTRRVKGKTHSVYVCEVAP